jgi:hypothetical protein
VAVAAGWLAATACAGTTGSTPPGTSRPASVETPEQVASACAPADPSSSCAPLADQLRELLVPGQSVSVALTMSEVRAGGAAGLRPETARAVRALAWTPPMAKRLDDLAQCDRKLGEHERRDEAWRMSPEGQAQFAALTLNRSLALDAAERDGRRDIAAFADRLETKPR